MIRSLNQTNRLKLEPLENRCLLAGDVTASVVGNVLQLRGDAEANQVAISAAFDGTGTAIPDSFVITGLTGTTINGLAGSGGANASIVFGGVRGIDARMGDGDDVIQLTNASIRNNVNIQTGMGNDQVWLGAFAGQTGTGTGLGTIVPGLGSFGDFTAPTLSTNAGPVLIRGNLTVNTGADDDMVAASDVQVNGNATVDAGAGDDQVFLAALNDMTSTVAGTPATAVINDPNPDQSLLVRGALHVNLGAGVDTLNALHATSRQGFFISDPQRNTNFTLNDVDGGSAGVVITRSPTSSNNGNGGDNSSDDDNSDDNSDGNSNGNANSDRLTRLYERILNLLDQLYGQMGQTSSQGLTSLTSSQGLTSLLAANGNGNGKVHHHGHSRD